jgi:glycosyltransferase involved in cell wall biosynthesis
LREAKGSYIAFLDSDDVWLPGKLENQLAAFGDQRTVIVFSNYEKINETGGRSNRVVKSPGTVGYKKLLKSNCIGCLTAVYDTSRVGKVFFEYFHHEDYILWLTILSKGYIAQNTNTVEALYRVRTNSVSSKKGIVFKWQWEIYRRYLHLPLFRSVYYFCFYLINGFLKYII